jgi:hypothetical protein
MQGGLKRYNRAEDYFISLSAFYKKQTYTVDDNIETYSSNGTGSVGPAVDYTVRKNAWGINAEIGRDLIWRHWTFEWFAGICVRVKTVQPSISDTLLSTLYDYTEGDISRLTNTRAWHSVLPSLPCGIRLGYCFWRKKGRRG